jgi:mannose-6-phosphate isomerase-like protein (cupin superfamily)
MTERPEVFNVLRGEAHEVAASPYGSVGSLAAAEGIEVVWVSKDDEEVDPGWFSQDRVDVILVVQGQLRFEFADARLATRVLNVGDCLILPAGTRCRAYRWPRDRHEATVFVAMYPSAGAGGAPGRAGHASS